MLLRLIKKISKWIFKEIENGGRAMNEAEMRIMFGDRNDSNKK